MHHGKCFFSFLSIYIYQILINDEISTIRVINIQYIISYDQSQYTTGIHDSTTLLFNSTSNYDIIYMMTVQFL